MYETLVVVNALNRLSISVSFRRYRPLKLPSSCEVVQKGGFWAPDLWEEGVSQISDMRFQITLTSDHVADFRRVPFSDLGD